MKRPKLEEFIQREGTPYAENTKTGKEIILFEHEKSNLYLRTMFEEDVNQITKIGKLKTKTKRQLIQKIKKQQSDEHCCILQELHKYDENGERKFVGLAEIKEKDITINIIIQKQSNFQEYEYESMSIFARVDSIITDMFGMMDIEWNLIMHSISV